ncbi:hypothetical protein VII00023_20347 [Vibrio ichthyoenteri ATCC 700023]|uniref:GIY-YIG domain-containing protein n=1 Tax=Vibrio ichthyoenteri ATCC 700023 TaxID=870968 RepID=F9RXQ2_9VIBR|nr:GIY-YIG nuclease family protein [Vibrio ichthyoenteri]EGU47781.1 hypothetical protein VII00023_20347 [Vibrio ichthyoenteri ATCC 700023]
MASDTSTHWSVYFVRMRSNRLYCGITTDVERRFKQHCTGTGAKALKGQGPLVLAWFHPAGNDRSIASKLEYSLKQISKAQKEALICGEIALKEVISQEYYAQITRAN